MTYINQLMQQTLGVMKLRYFLVFKGLYSKVVGRAVAITLSGTGWRARGTATSRPPVGCTSAHCGVGVGGFAEP